MHVVTAFPALLLHPSTIGRYQMDSLEGSNRQGYLVDRRSACLIAFPGSGEGSDLAGVVSYLRQQLDVLEEEKQLARHEADRLRGEGNVLKRTIDGLRAQVASEEDRQQRVAREEGLFRERKETQANFNMVKESNASLRSWSLVPPAFESMLCMLQAGSAMAELDSPTSPPVLQRVTCTSMKTIIKPSTFARDLKFGLFSLAAVSDVFQIAK